jgi:hypothetical protein
MQDRLRSSSRVTGGFPIDYLKGADMVETFSYNMTDAAVTA